MHHTCIASTYRASKSPRNEPTFGKLILRYKRIRYIIFLVLFNSPVTIKNYREFDHEFRYFHR